MSGYQSHFVVTTKEGMPIDELHKYVEYNELVVAQEAQATPVFLVYVEWWCLAQPNLGKFHRLPLPRNGWWGRGRREGQSE